MTEVQTRHDEPRGCGSRKPGGLYLVSSGEGVACCKLPIALTCCPTCSAGIKFCRGWTWIDADRIFPATECTSSGKAFCRLACPPFGRWGLLWVGAQFYKTPADFTDEAARLGISRRISTLPKEFKL